MSNSEYSCPACGASLEIEHRFTKVVICSYCGQTSTVSSSGLKVEGKQAALLELDSIFKIGTSGSIDGIRFKVLGCLRYQYSDGFWDEWFLSYENGKTAWLQEDEGEFTAYQKSALTNAIPSFDELRVGSSFEVNGMSVFITEKSDAEIIGGAGELFFTAIPGTSVKCIDGNSSGRLVSIEITSDEINLSIGKEIDFESIVLD